LGSDKDIIMDTLKKHVDTLIILGAFASSVLWMNSKFNDIDKQFKEIEKDIVMIKTVLIIQKIMPNELVFHSIDDPDGIGFVPFYKVKGE
jgi:hypothetical protein